MDSTERVSKMHVDLPCCLCCMHVAHACSASLSIITQYYMHATKLHSMISNRVTSYAQRREHETIYVPHVIQCTHIRHLHMYIYMHTHARTHTHTHTHTYTHTHTHTHMDR
jgi:hypothetical protein